MAKYKNNYIFAPDTILTHSLVMTNPMHMSPSSNYSLEDFKEGQLLLIDKPLGWTSFQVVNKVRWLIRSQYKIKKIKVGHAGTLDPLATGLLIICMGKMTKQIDTYQGLPKTYTGTFEIGTTTPSYDKETSVDQHYPTAHITAELLEQTRQSFLGEQAQTPPIFSAIKKDGERLYNIARKGQMTDIPSRQINIHTFELTKLDLPLIDFKVRCSKGTFIRSLAHDFGQRLQSGAHLAALRRTAIGDYSVDDAISVEQFEKMVRGA